jgi:hypothetical protein
VSARNSKTETFDVFLCHNSEDKPAIRQIAQKLAERKIRPWLDEEEIRPGTSWQMSLGQQIESIKSAAVFVGASGLGPWQNLEIQALLSQFVKRACPVIPVVLPSAKITPELPWTLANLHWVDFRVTDMDPFAQLIWGITGEKPREASHVTFATDLAAPRGADVKELLPSKQKLVIEIRLPGKNIDEFSPEERDSILTGIYSLLKISEVRVTRAMAGSIRLHLTLKPEDADKIYNAAQNGQLTVLGITEARLYPAIAVCPNREQRSQLLVLLDQVNKDWVEGVLRDSLYNEVLISLGKSPMNDAVEPTWNHAVEFSSQRSQLVLQDRKIITIFDATGLLLILGEPGSGKTTTLLELAADLIGRAKVDGKERVPVVLNLSTWKKNQSLSRWISAELSEKYRVPAKIARSWLQNDYLLPLLDGLDEVPSYLQPDCVTAVNDFIDGFEPSGIVVCCRLNEYQWLPKRLKLNGGIRIEPLSSTEVSNYLAKGGPKLAVLRQAVDIDPVLQELTQTPLMLSIVSLACHGDSGNKLAEQKGASIEERRKQIFGLYVDQMFQRKTASSLLFPKEKTIGWISWLAGKMRENSQSVFLVEGLQPGWLGTKAERIAFGAIVALSLALISQPMSGLIGLICGLTIRPSYGITVGVIVGSTFTLATLFAVGLGYLLESLVVTTISGGIAGGLIGTGLIVWTSNRKPWESSDLVWLFSGLALTAGLIAGVGAGSPNRISPVETIAWKWSRSLKWAIACSCPGIFLLIFVLSSWMSSPQDGLFSGWLNLLALLVILGIVFSGLIIGTLAGFTGAVKVRKGSPNEGIKLSRRNSSVALFICLLGGAIPGLIFWAAGWIIQILGLICGLIAGVFFGTYLGGSAVIKHHTLRLILWMTGHTPFKFIKFLDHCSRLILLKKVGGGYIFIHRMLLDYFADLPKIHERKGRG